MQLLLLNPYHTYDLPFPPKSKRKNKYNTSHSEVFHKVRTVFFHLSPEPKS